MATRELKDTTKTIKGMKRGELAKKFADLGFNYGVEVGVCTGAFSEVLCKANPNLSLKSVDPYNVVYNDYRTMRIGEEEQQDLFVQATERLAPYNCEIIRKTSLEAVVDFPYESIDFVYIDGSHEFDYVMTDLIEWGKRVKKGGIISGHDYYKFRYGDVVRSVDNYAHVHGVRKIYLTDERTPSFWFEKTW